MFLIEKIKGADIMVYKIEVFNKNWQRLEKEYAEEIDRQAAELRAERLKDELGGEYFDVTVIH